MKVLFAGDYCDTYRVSDLIKKGQYDAIFSEIKPIVESADISVVNFEMPIVAEGAHPIKKSGVALKGQPKAVDAIKFAGFNVCALANNHILDQGDDCCLDTIRRIHKAGLECVGAGSNIEEASKVLYLKKNNETLAIINCCEHEFSIASETSAGANPLNPIRQYYAIQEANKNADYVVVIIHGGPEHHQLPTPRMMEINRFFVDVGADAVICHHQHCFSGYELYNTKLIFYGLGNLCFDWNEIEGIRNYGYMVAMTFASDSTTFEIIPYKQCSNDNASVELIDPSSVYQKIEEINDTISNPEKLCRETNSYYEQSIGELHSIFEPIQNRFISALQRKKYLPSLVSCKWLLKIENYIMCESHRDKVEYWLEKVRKGKVCD